MHLKVCISCKEEKESSLFFRKNTSADGLDYYCKNCKVSINNKYKDNPHLRKEFKSKDKDYIKHKGREYYRKNRDSILSKMKQKYVSVRKPARTKAETDAVRKRAQDRYRKNSPLKYLYCCAKRRAKSRGMEFNIEPSDLVMIDICPLLGIKIDSHHPDKMNHASIDRIDSSKGYIKGNVMMISLRANVLKNNSTSDELALLAKNLKKYEAQL